jgi:hypothetical protein
MMTDYLAKLQTLAALGLLDEGEGEASLFEGLPDSAPACYRALAGTCESAASPA